jgi:putative oxidoreductase
MSAGANAWIEAQLDRLGGPLLLIGRVLLAAVFIYDATLMVRFPVENAAYMGQFGVPAALLYPTAVFQVVGGLMIVLGLWLRPVALAFAGFCLLTAILFHHDFAAASELIQFGKDVGLAGGFLLLAVGNRLVAGAPVR